jgi:hypothetical protein
VEGDEGCRVAAARIATAAQEAASDTAAGAVSDRRAGQAPPAQVITAVLTPEEIAEFERLAAPAGSRAGRPAEREGRTSSSAPEPTVAASLRARFMEN